MVENFLQYGSTNKNFPPRAFSAMPAEIFLTVHSEMAIFQRLYKGRTKEVQGPQVAHISIQFHETLLFIFLFKNDSRKFENECTDIL
jgi:hypothetical protein